MRALIVCEPEPTCADPNINRWYCHRGMDGAKPGACPLTLCDLRGANRASVSTEEAKP